MTKTQKMTDALTAEALLDMIKQYPTPLDLNTEFKAWVKRQQDIPDDAVYLVPELLFERLNPDPDIYLDRYVDEDKIVVMSRAFIENPQIPHVPMPRLKEESILPNWGFCYV